MGLVGWILSNEVFDVFFEKCYTRNFKRNTQFLSEGDQESQLRLVTKGLVKSYRIKSADCKECINWIIQEGGIASSVVSLFKEKASTEYLETIEDTEMICMKNSDLYQLIDQNAEICKLVSKWMLEFLVKYDRRVDLYRHAKPEERLKHFMVSQPNLLKRLSKKEIASFLDIAPGTLSAAFKKMG